MNVTVINIEWEKFPYDVRNFNQNQMPKVPRDNGLYQICGQHPAYGNDALLYIGKTQSFEARLQKRERWEFFESTVRATSVHFGTIVQSNTNQPPLGWEEGNLDKIVEITERILIKAHSPALNTQEIKGLFGDDELKKYNVALNEKNLETHFLIINWEEYGQLLREISTLRMSDYYGNFDNPVKKKNRI